MSVASKLIFSVVFFLVFPKISYCQEINLGCNGGFILNGHNYEISSGKHSSKIEMKPGYQIGFNADLKSNNVVHRLSFQLERNVHTYYQGDFDFNYKFYRTTVVKQNFLTANYSMGFKLFRKKQWVNSRFYATLGLSFSHSVFGSLVSDAQQDFLGVKTTTHIETDFKSNTRTMFGTGFLFQKNITENFYLNIMGTYRFPLNYINAANNNNIKIRSFTFDLGVTFRINKYEK